MASSLSTISISFLPQPLARYNKNNGSSRKTNPKKHINPMLQFSKRLAAKGLRVTLVTTTAHKNLIQNQSTSSINFEHISNGFNEGQKPDCFNLFVQGLKAESSKGLPKIIEKLENSGYPLNAIVYDACIPWILDIAKEIGLYGVSFFTQSCAVSAIYYHSHKGTVKIPVEKGSVICLPAIPELGICNLPSFVSDVDSYPGILRLVLDRFSNFQEADCLFFNTFDKLEDEAGDPLYVLLCYANLNGVAGLVAKQSMNMLIVAAS